MERLASLRTYDILDTACEAAYDEIAALAARLTGSPMALISLIDSDRQWVKARAGIDIAEIPREQAFCAYAIHGTTPLVVADATADARFADNPFVTGPPHVRFYAGVPLLNVEGFALGALCVIGHEPRDLPADQRETLAALARTAMTTLELHRAMNHVRTLALTDSLTGLANRSALLDALDRAIAGQRRHGEAFALIYLDLDGFKAVNDVFGHVVGDRALHAAAQAMRAVARRADLVARIGGDEFAMLLTAPVGTPAVNAAHRVREAVGARMQALGWPVTASVGAVRFGTPPRDAGRAMATADQLMYAAKLSGKNCVMFIEHDHTGPE